MLSTQIASAKVMFYTVQAKLARRFLMINLLLLKRYCEHLKTHTQEL